MNDRGAGVVEQDDEQITTSLFDLLAEELPELEGPWMTTSSTKTT